MRRLLQLLGLLALASCARAQTVANFDTPACSGNGVGVYQGIDFSLSPWDCEKSSTLPGDATETISWYQNISTGKFKFVQPSILTSLRGGGSNGSGIFTVTTDAGETFSQNLPKGVTLLQTGFTKPASVVTIYYQGWWTIEVDDITYTTPPPLTLVRAKFTFDDATPVAGSVQVFQIAAGAPVSLGSFPLDATGLVSANLPLDPNSQYHAQLANPSGAVVQDFWSVNASASLAAAAIAALPKLELDVVLFKATGAVKSIAAIPAP